LKRADLRGIEDLLASRIGLDPASVGSTLIVRAARRQMKALGLDRLDAYEDRIRSSGPELQALVEEVIVAESWFFRDEQPFECFREYVRAHRHKSLPAPPLRILSLACAGGEEPYSIAMTLLDLGLPPRRFLIDAIDISAHQLAIARGGIYSPNSFRGRDLGYRDRHFRPHPAGYELDPTIRGAVQFLHANVLDPDLLERSSAYDVVFCRNLLIYLSAPARVGVVAVIDRLLAPEGLLIIGHADRLDLSGTPVRFTAVGGPACFAYRRAARGHASLPGLPFEPAQPVPHWVARPSTSTTAPAARAPVHDGGARFQPGGPDETAVSPAAGDSPATLLEQAADLANQGRFSEAVAACQQHLQHVGLSADAYYLMGMICQAAGDRRRAEECFHKVVYLDPRHDEALLSLALLAERRGDLAAATGFRRRAERTMTRK
jgi:chemotaxis protein methyltransferase WspC